MNVAQLENLNEIDISLEKAYAILEQYRSNAYVDNNELSEIDLKMIATNHEHNSLLFCAAIDYLAAAMNGLEQQLNNN